MASREIAGQDACILKQTMSLSMLLLHHITSSSTSTLSSYFNRPTLFPISHAHSEGWSCNNFFLQTKNSLFKIWKKFKPLRHCFSKIWASTKDIRNTASTGHIFANLIKRFFVEWSGTFTKNFKMHKIYLKDYFKCWE